MLNISKVEMIHQVIVNVTQPPVHGNIVSRTSNDSMTVNQFMYMDMERGLIEYVLSERHTRSLLDTFMLTFKLGHGCSNPVQFRVCLLTLPHPHLVTNGVITADEQSEETITRNILRAKQTRHSQGTARDVRFYITRQPTYGKLINQTRTNSLPLSTFTQEDIDASRIAYYNQRLPSQLTHLNDSFAFTLGNQFYNLTHHVYTVRIVFSFTGIKTVCQLRVTEGENHTITPLEFFAVAPLGFTITTVYISVLPTQGDFVIAPEGLTPYDRLLYLSDITNSYISYHHNISNEEDTDSFDYFIMALSDSKPSINYESRCEINITLINDNKPKEILNFAPIVGDQGSVAITSNENLRMKDADYGFDDNDRNNDLKYVLRDPYYHGPYQGYLYFSNDPGHRIRTWYQRDMNGKLRYQHDGLIGRDYMSINVSDGLNIARIGFHVIVKSIILTSIGSKVLNIQEGSVTSLTLAQLAYSVDIDSVQSKDYVYTITDPPSRGVIRFKLGSEPVSNFTQADLENRLLVYQHDGSEGADDRFNFNVSVKSHSTSDAVSILISAVDDQFPQLVVNKPLFVKQELMFAWFNSSHLLIQDNDTLEESRLSCIVVRGPRAGKLVERPSPSFTPLPLPEEVANWTEISSFTQMQIGETLIWYHLSNLSAWTDSFTFRISDGTNNPPEIYTKQIIIDPPTLPVAMGEVTVKEGESVIFPRSSFRIDHPSFATLVATIHIKSSLNGQFRMNGEQVRDFTTEDLSQERVEYVHDGSEGTPASFIFQLEAGSRRSDILTFEINVEPVNDNPPVLSVVTTLELWAGQTVQISQLHLLATDRDLPPDTLLYCFRFETNQAVNGYFAHRATPNIATSNFTQADINNGDILFVDLHTYDEPWNISFTVTDGKFVTHGHFALIARTLELNEVLLVPVSVQMGSNVTITNSSLRFELEYDLDDQIFYTLRPNSPQHGSLYFTSNLTRPIRRFTRSDVNRQAVLYVHQDRDVWEPLDQLKIIVSNPLALKDVEATLNVSIRLPPVLAGPLAAAGSLTLKENNRSCLNQTILDGRNFRYDTWKRNKTHYFLSDVRLLYRISTPPQFGRVLVSERETQNFTHEQVTAGVVCYQHSKGTESSRDRFILEVVVMSSTSVALNSTMANIGVIIDLYNDEKPVLVSSSLQKNFIEGFRLPITREDLAVEDKDNPPSDIIFTILEIQGANNSLKLDGEPVRTFTQKDINNRSLIFDPSQPIESRFTFTFSDGKFSSQNYTFVLSVAEYFMHVEKKDISLSQIEPSIVFSSNIIRVHTNGLGEEPKISVVDGPFHGQLNVSGKMADSFRQSDVDSGLVRYSFTADNAYSDYFRLNVTKKYKSEMVTVNIMIEANVSSMRQSMVLSQAFSQVLPSGMFDFSSLQRKVGSDRIRLELVEKLKYGELSLKHEPDNSPLTQFLYADYGEFLCYTWIKRQNLTIGERLTETLSVQVLAKGFPPGYMSVNFTVIVPAEAIIPMNVTVSPSPSTSPSSSAPSSGSPTEPRGSPNVDFINLLVPVVGLVVLVLVLTIVTVVFCMVHSGRILNKLKSKTAGSILSFPSHRGLSSRRAQSHSSRHSAHLGGNEADDMAGEISLSSDTSSAASIEMLPPHQFTHKTFPPSFLPSSVHTSQEYMASVHGYGGEQTYSENCGSMYEDDDSSLRGTPFRLQRILESPVPTNNMLHRSPLHSSARLEHSHGFKRGSLLRATSPVRVNGSRYSVGRTSGRSSPTKSSVRELTYVAPLRRTYSRDSSTTMGYESESSGQRETPRLGLNGTTNSAATAAAVSAAKAAVTAAVTADPATATLFRSANPALKETEYWV